MNLTLRQLRAFAEIARLGSFTEAAGRLSLTQSATSGLLRELERQLGLPLVDRTTRRASLTAAGREFLVHTQRVLADVEQAVASTQGLLSKSRGYVSVAVSPLIAATLMPAAIRRFGLAYPGVTIALHDVLTDQILHHVRSGTADFGVGTFQSTHTELELVTLFVDRLGAVVPAASALGAKRRLKWSDLQDQPNIALTTTSAFRSLIDATYQQLRLRMPAPRFEVGYMGTAVALVEAGLGVSVLPERAAALFRTGGARWLALGTPLITQSAMLVKRAGKSLSPAASAFAALLAKCP
jgi:DNA-binding transcriptional LysR family regulator